MAANMARAGVVRGQPVLILYGGEGGRAKAGRGLGEDWEEREGTYFHTTITHDQRYS